MENHLATRIYDGKTTTRETGQKREISKKKRKQKVPGETHKESIGKIQNELINQISFYLWLD